MAEEAAVHVRNRHVVEALENAVRSGSHGLTVVPELLRRCLQDESWREFTTARDEHVVHGSFVEFVRTAPLKGLGADVSLVRRLVADDPEALSLLDHALAGGHVQRSDLVDDVDEVETPTGSARENALRRLHQHAPELHARLASGELTANAAMIEAGLRKRTVSVKPDDPEATARTLRRQMKPEQISELIRALRAET